MSLLLSIIIYQEYNCISQISLDHLRYKKIRIGSMSKFQTEITDMVVFWKKSLKFLQVV